RPRPGTATPKQFGPTSRIPCCRQVSSRWVFPETPRPELITTRHRAPRFPHSLATLHTWAGGTATTASTGAVGRADTDGRRGPPGDLVPGRVGRGARARDVGGAVVARAPPPPRPCGRGAARARARGGGAGGGGAGRAPPPFPVRHRVQVGAVRAQRRGAGDG